MDLARLRQAIEQGRYAIDGHRLACRLLAGEPSVAALAARHRQFQGGGRRASLLLRGPPAGR